MSKRGSEQIVASFDLGSDTARGLLAARQSDGSLRVLAQATSMTALGRGLSGGDDLSSRAIDATVRFVSETLQQWADTWGRPARIFAVATAAVRDTGRRDADRLFSRLRDEAGVDAEVIEGREEACLAWLGAISSLDEGEGLDPVVVDIGGRSTEFVARDGDAPAEEDALTAVSLSVGARSLTERFLRSDPPSEREVAQARSHAEEVVRPGFPLAAHRASMIAVGGTATAARILRASTLSREQIEAIEQQLCALPVAQRREMMPFDPERAGIICGGLIILGLCAAAAPGERLIVSDGGVREGLLLDRTGATRLLT